MKRICICLLMIFILTGKAAGEEGWKEVKSTHIIVYYKNTPKSFAENVLNAAEDYYDEITDNLGFNSYKGWSFDDRAKIYVYDSQQDYMASARQSNWSSGAAYYYQRTIRTFPASAGFFDSLLPHELGHIIFHEFIGMRTSIPLWFDEGVAMYQEKAQRWGADQSVKKALAEETFIPLPELDRVRLTAASSRELVELFYAESASVVAFLINDQGEFRFSNLCRKLQGGDKFIHAMERVYPRFKNLDRLNEAWVSYLERQ